MSRYAVAVIDMQKAYFQAGDLQGQEKTLVSAANHLISTAIRIGIPVFNVITLHERDRSTWTLNMLDDEQGYLFKGDEGAEVVDGLYTEGTTTFTKTRDSAFFQTSLANQLEEAAIDTLILLGVSTHSCIYQTASDAYAHNIRIHIAEDAVATHDRQWHDPALEVLVQEYRQSVKGIDELCELLGQNKSASS